MPRPSPWTPEQKAEALDLAKQVGTVEAGRRTGIPAGTVASWCHRKDVATPFANPDRAKHLDKTRRARVVTLAERKATLALGLLTDIERLRDQLFAPSVERKVVATGQIVDVHHDEPPTGDKKALMTTIAIAVDKVLLLVGDATQRTEVVTPADREQITQRLAEVIKLRAAS